MGQELISAIFDEEKIGQQVKKISTLITDWLNSTEKDIKELTDKSINLHLTIKSDTNFKDLIANMKEFAKVSQQVETANQKFTNVQNQITAAANQTGEATKKLIFWNEKEKKSIEETTTALDNAGDAYRFYSDGLKAVKKDLSENSAALAKAKEQVKEYSKRLADMQNKAAWTPVSVNSIKEVEEKLGNAAARVEEYTQKVKENKQQVQLAQIVEDGLVSSYEVREAMMRRLLNIAKEMGNETEEEKFHQQELATAINTLNDSLKEQDISWGNHQRSVGDYEIATKNLRAIIIDLNDQMTALTLAGKGNSEEYKALQRDLAKYKAELIELQEPVKGVRATITDLVKEMTNLKIAGQEDSATYQDLQKKVTEYNKALVDVQKETKNLRSETASFDAMRQSLQALNIAFISLQQMGGFEEQSEESEILNDVMGKLEGTIALVSMATEIYSLVGKNSAVITKIQTFQASLLAKAQTMQTTATGKATIAQRLFNLAAKANPYLLLITGIAALIGVFALFSKKVSAAEQAQKDLNKVQEESAKIAQDETAKLNMLMQKATIYNKNNRERLDAIRQINEQYGDYLPKLLTEKSTVKEIMAAYESLTVVIQKQAIIRASMEMISEKTKERIELAMAEVTVQEELRAEQQKYAKIYNEWKKAEKAYNSEREKHTYDQLKLILQLEKKHERNIRRLKKKKKNWQSKGKKTQKK